MALPHICTKAPTRARTPYLTQALFRGEVQRSGEDTTREYMLNGDVWRWREDTYLVLPYIYTKAPSRAKHPSFKGEVRRRL